MQEILPDYVKKWVQAFKPFMKFGVLLDAPQSAIDAFEKYKQWSWEQPQ